MVLVNYNNPDWDLMRLLSSLSRVWDLLWDSRGDVLISLRVWTLEFLVERLRCGPLTPEGRPAPRTPPARLCPKRQELSSLTKRSATLTDKYLSGEAKWMWMYAGRCGQPHWTALACPKPIIIIIKTIIPRHHGHSAVATCHSQQPTHTHREEMIPITCQSMLIMISIWPV